MAKKKAVSKAPAANNDKPMTKSAAVRAIIGTGVKEIKEIQRLAKQKYGLDIGYQTVYGLLKPSKSSKAKGSKTAKKKVPAASANGAGNVTVFAAGVQFIRAAGGIEQAKAVLQTIEDIRSL